MRCKHELGGADVPEALSSEGVEHDWCVEFRDHAIGSHEFLSHSHFQRHFIGSIFTVNHFTSLMCHRYIMVKLEGGKYLMPVLLDPLSSEGLRRECKLVDPLVVSFPSRCTPCGLFSCLVGYLLKKLVEKNAFPVCVVVRPRRIDNSEPVHCATGAARADRTSYMLYVGH